MIRDIGLFCINPYDTPNPKPDYNPNGNLIITIILTQSRIYLARYGPTNSNPKSSAYYEKNRPVPLMQKQFSERGLDKLTFTRLLVA